jgi:hypothetical protein
MFPVAAATVLRAGFAGFVFGKIKMIPKKNLGIVTNLVSAIIFPGTSTVLTNIVSQETGTNRTKIVFSDHGMTDSIILAFSTINTISSMPVTHFVF